MDEVEVVLRSELAVRGEWGKRVDSRLLGIATELAALLLLLRTVTFHLGVLTLVLVLFLFFTRDFLDLLLLIILDLHLLRLLLCARNFFVLAAMEAVAFPVVLKFFLVIFNFKVVRNSILVAMHVLVGCLLESLDCTWSVVEAARIIWEESCLVWVTDILDEVVPSRSSLSVSDGVVTSSEDSVIISKSEVLAECVAQVTVVGVCSNLIERWKDDKENLPNNFEEAIDFSSRPIVVVDSEPSEMTMAWTMSGFGILVLVEGMANTQTPNAEVLELVKVVDLLSHSARTRLDNFKLLFNLGCLYSVNTELLEIVDRDVERVLVQDVQAVHELAHSVALESHILFESRSNGTDESFPRSSISGILAALNVVRMPIEIAVEFDSAHSFVESASV